jgi:hypothetical protein
MSVRSRDKAALTAQADVLGGDPLPGADPMPLLVICELS